MCRSAGLRFRGNTPATLPESHLFSYAKPYTPRIGAALLSGLSLHRQLLIQLMQRAIAPQHLMYA